MLSIRGLSTDLYFFWNSHCLYFLYFFPSTLFTVTFIYFYIYLKSLANTILNVVLSNIEVKIHTTTHLIIIRNVYFFIQNATVVYIGKATTEVIEIRLKYVCCLTRNTSITFFLMSNTNFVLAMKYSDAFYVSSISFSVVSNSFFFLSAFAYYLVSNCFVFSFTNTTNVIRSTVINVGIRNGYRHLKIFLLYCTLINAYPNSLISFVDLAKCFQDLGMSFVIFITFIDFRLRNSMSSYL